MMGGRRMAALATALAAAAAVGAAAQNTSPSLSQSPSQEERGEPAGAVPLFRTSASLVLVDVVVREKGKPVEGLRQTDFEVLQDGKPQAITVFEEHRATDTEQAARAPALPPHVYGDFPHYTVGSAANVLLLDALNTPLNDQTYARAQMLKLLGAIPPGTEMAVFTLASRLRMVSGFTTDAGTIAAALSPEHTPPQKSPMGSASESADEKQIDATMGAQIPEIQAEVRDFESDQRAFQDQQRMAITLGAFSELARYLSTVPGRKNLIWVSGGLAGALDPDLSRMNGPEAARFAPAVRVVNAELTRARVAVYPVDARAQMTLTDADGANVVAPTEHGSLAADLQGAQGEAEENDVGTPRRWANSQLEMKRVAADTGGAAFVNTNALGKAVTEAIAEGENYYTLGYAPPDAASDGRYHTIAVRMVEGKYELAYRRGYFAVDAGDAGQQTMLSPMTEAMEHGVPPVSQVIFEARVLAAGDPELHGQQPAAGPAGMPAAPLNRPVTRYFIDYSIDPRQLVFRDVPATRGSGGPAGAPQLIHHDWTASGKQEAELEVTQAVYDADGKRLNSTDAGLQVTMTAEQKARAMTDGIRLRQEIDVPAGPVWLKLGVRDATSGRIGTVEVREQATGNRE